MKKRGASPLPADRFSLTETQFRRALLDREGSLLFELLLLLLDELEGEDGRLAVELRDGAGARVLDELREGADGRLTDELRGDGAGRLTEPDPLGARGATTRPRLEDPLCEELESRSGTIRAPPIRSITRRGIGAELVSLLRAPSEPSPSRPVSFRYVGELRHCRSGAGASSRSAQLRSGAGGESVVHRRSGAVSGARSG